MTSTMTPEQVQIRGGVDEMGRHILERVQELMNPVNYQPEVLQALIGVAAVLEACQELEGHNSSADHDSPEISFGHGGSWQSGW